MNPPGRITIEVCVDSLDAAIAARDGGADRLELNMALELDGLTPSAGLVHSVLSSVSIPVIAMVRPRAGDFVYSASELQTMERDARWLLDAGVAGLAFGILGTDGRVNQDAMALLVDICRASHREPVMHRAFDCVADQVREMERLVGLGIQRVMTSGGATAATQAVEVIRDLVDRFERGAEDGGADDGAIQILPAGGINEDNAVDLVRRSSARQIHGSFSAGGVRTPAQIEASVRKTRERLDQLR